MSKGQRPAGIELSTSRLGEWNTFASLPGGSKVLCARKLPLSTLIYHRLEWRFASAILANSRLRLSPVSSWQDPYESWWCKNLFERGASPLYGVNAYALCWTISSFDEPAWRMVGYGRSEPIVRITATVMDLLKAAKASLASQPGSWFLGRVHYKRTNTLEQLASRLERPPSAPMASSLKDVGRNAASLLLRKRNAFRFEQEIRLIFLDQKHSAPRDQVFLPIDSSLITDVMLSPHAPDHFGNVRDELALHGLRLRKSQVLDLPHRLRVVL